MERLIIKIYSSHLSIYYLILVGSQIFNLIQCNPIAFSPNSLPMIAISPGAYHPAYQGSPAAMMMASQYDPFASMQASYFMPASPYTNPWASFDAASRRSLPGIFGGGTRSERSSGGNRDKSNHNDEPTDEQKALDGLPLSFIEPDPPSTITERLSESFSALGEGVKNHFRSISENFSDTMDDIRDAWRPARSNGESNTSRKRRS